MFKLSRVLGQQFATLLRLWLCVNASILHFCPFPHIYHTCTIQYRLDFLFSCVLGTPVPCQPILCLQLNLDAYSEHKQLSKMQPVSKIVNSFQSLTIFTRSSILDVCLASETLCFVLLTKTQLLNFSFLNLLYFLNVYLQQNSSYKIATI